VAFSFFDHTGDVGVRVRARSLGLLFADAAFALTDVVTDRRLVTQAQSVPVELSSTAVDLLLVDWLNDLIYRFDADSFVVACVEVSVRGEGSEWTLRGKITGERLDPARHRVKTLVKAATYHALGVSRAGDEWQATFVLDV
jgi:SHS2 domain-containing protein